MYLLYKKLLIILYLYYVSSYGVFPQYMSSSSGRYLISLDRQRRIEQNSKGIQFHKDLIDNTNICNKKEIEVDSIILNINKVQNIYFTINCPKIALMMRQPMNNTYYITEDGLFEKLTNNTKISSSKICNFLAYEFDSTLSSMNDKIECILYNSKYIKK